MRLFTAILFSDQIKDGLFTCMRNIKEASIRGNFSQYENLHLTLVFLGETNRLDAVTRAMDRINGESFEMQTDGIGYFSRNGGKIMFARIQENNNLTRLQAQLTKELKIEGFSPEERAFRPHLTLGREIVLRDDRKVEDFKLPALFIPVNKISLMNSERINGKLVYTEIYAKELI